MFDYRFSKIEIKRFSFNKRIRTNIVLLRYCSNSKHTNPDGTQIGCPHIHIYNEKYADKFAYNVNDVLNIEPQASKEKVLIKLMDYCNIVERPTIQFALGVNQ
jgi:hypothetical protein